MNDTELTITPLVENDFSVWKRLYQNYLTFYKTELTAEQLNELFSWFFNLSKEMHCYLASYKDQPVGLIHFREYLRPIKVTTAIYIDDLYVDNDYRSMGIARQLIHAVYSCLVSIFFRHWRKRCSQSLRIRLFGGSVSEGKC